VEILGTAGQVVAAPGGYDEQLEIGTLSPMNVKPSDPPKCLPQ
jgi:hypothetical protein